MVCDKVLACVRAELSAESGGIACKRREECIVSSDTRSSVKCGEKGKQYILENDIKEHVINYLVDGGIILKQHTKPKCDGLFVIQTENSMFDVVLIELKGKDVKHAFEQLLAVIELEEFSALYRACSHVYARIVMASACPNLKADPKYVKLARAIRRYDGNLKIDEKRFVERRTGLKSET